MTNVKRCGIALLGTLLVGCLGNTEDTTTVSSAIVTSSPFYWDDPFGSPGSNPCYSAHICQNPVTQALIHCCGPGEAMVGAYLATNSFRCVKLIQPGQIESGCSENGTAAWNGGRKCPTGKYLKGFHQAQNRLLCCSYPMGNTPSNFRIDGDAAPEPTPMSGAIVNGACPAGTANSAHVCSTNDSEVMSGLNTVTNQFLCDS